MVTPYPRHFLSPTADVPEARSGVGARILEWMRQLSCGMRGHDNMLHFEKDRMFLQCASCGRRSPGWELTETRPTVTVRGDVRPAMRPQLVSARRIA